jgi:translin
MTEMEHVLESVILELESLDKQRETVIQLTRKLNRTSGRGIARLVKRNDYSKELEASRSYVQDISVQMEQLAPVTSWNITISGTEEYVEFELLHAIMSNNPIQGPDQLQIPSYIWISGLGDTIGELRRIMLNAIIRDDMNKARNILHKINELYSLIAGLEFSKSMVPNLRRKVDIARTLIERSESDFVNALVNKRT